MAQRRADIDIARGISMITIVIMHMSISPLFASVTTLFNLPIFMLISGYYMDRDIPWRDFLRRQARTLLVPYALTCAFICLLSVPANMIRGWDPLQELLRWIYASVYASGVTYQTPFYIKQIGAIWYLPASFFASVLLRAVLERTPVQRLMILLAAFAAGVYTAKLCWLPLSIQAGACIALPMYAGWLIRRNKTPALSGEAKMLCIVGAACMWLWCIRNYKGFYFVECRFGNGMADALGALAACWLLMLACAWVDRHLPLAGRGLAYLGRYSLLMLCAHIVEQNLFPWKLFSQVLAGRGVSGVAAAAIMMLVKMTGVIGATVLLSRIRRIRRAFGYRG